MQLKDRGNTPFISRENTPAHHIAIVLMSAPP